MSAELEKPSWLDIDDEDMYGGSYEPPEKQPDPSYNFYDNTVTVYFDVENHEYYKLGKYGEREVIPGVTTVLGVISKPFLKQWAVKRALESLRGHVYTIDGALKEFTKEELEEWLEIARFAHKDTLENAGAIGTLAHDAIEEEIVRAIEAGDGVMRNRPIPNPDHPRVKGTEEQLRQAQNAADAGHAWAVAHNVRFLRTERKIYSRLYNYCGTLDGEALVDSCNDKLCKGCRGRVFKDRHSMIDWKTSNQLSSDYAWQVAAYIFAHLEEFTDLVIQDRWILRIGKEQGDFEPWFCHADTFEADLEAFLAALTLHNKKKEIEKRRGEEDKEFSAFVREEKKAITAANNEARDAYYKELRAQKTPVVEARKLADEKYPKQKRNTKPKEDKADDAPKIVKKGAVTEIKERPAVIEASSGRRIQRI